ncbi:MAG: hypothetical protein C0467_17635 [Planctomycetaceae bacterium]|nr:hypothetical protein [Planctomycetaceae bacterium]
MPTYKPPAPPKDVEKSIDSLQRIHALISALALGEAVRRLIQMPGTPEAEFHLSVLPQFLALVCTIVPFYHGMHRHLEATYLFPVDPKHPRGVLLIDFVVFLVEASTFFALASLFNASGFYWVLAALLVFDAIWSGLTALITQATEFRWCVLNFIAAIAMVVVLSLNVFRAGMDVWLLTIIAVVRTIFDYQMHWHFYFPFEKDETTVGGNAPPSGENPPVGVVAPPPVENPPAEENADGGGI